MEIDYHEHLIHDDTQLLLINITSELLRLHVQLISQSSDSKIDRHSDDEKEYKKCHRIFWHIIPVVIFNYVIVPCPRYIYFLICFRMDLLIFQLSYFVISGSD